MVGILALIGLTILAYGMFIAIISIIHAFYMGYKEIIALFF